MKVQQQQQAQAGALDALRGLLDVMNKDKDGDYFICEEAEQLVAHCRVVAEQGGAANFHHLDDREHATVLAALRYWQREGGIMAVAEWNIASNEETLVPLDDKDIDALCERLNCEG